VKRIFLTLPVLAVLAAVQPAAADRGPHRRPTFAELDTDGNGTVSEAEFVAPLLEHASERFTTLDADGNGSVTETEFVAPLVEHASEKFAAIDTDDDGAISEAELAAAPRGRGRRGNAQ
jgi:Ca2+-binding EF-hand superfamily protein